MIAKKLTTIATMTSSKISKDGKRSFLKTTSLISIIALRAKIPNVPVGLFRAELARELQSLAAELYAYQNKPFDDKNILPMDWKTRIYLDTSSYLSSTLATLSSNYPLPRC